MADEETPADETREGSDKGETENKRPDDTLAENKTCPECGAPVDDVRATCMDCGYEYKEEDHEDPEAGREFTSGSEVDDDGKESRDEEQSEEPTKDDPEDTD